MTIYQEVPLNKAYRLLNHGPTVMVSSAHGNKRNIMAVAWCCPIDYAPSKVMVVIDKQSYTQELINASGEFALLIPGKAMAQQVLQVGSITGRSLDKFETFNIVTRPAKTIAAPLVDGCLGCLECRLIPEPHNQQTYDMYLGEVTAAWADPRVFSDGRWHIEQEDLRSIHYQTGGEFFAIGESFHIEK